ncbi:MAG: D-aminoacylase [Chloroflexi bacterium]|nr:D-aminoacylase [Chloroflexota bacterium]
MTLDVLIQGGLVVDGSGGAAFPADVGVRRGTIEAVGRLDGARAERVIDARGLAVAPGFIDTHAHSELALLADPQHAPKLRQGVTTEILGQDGLSYAPLSPGNLRFYRTYLAGVYGDPAIAWDWSSVAEFRARFDRTVAVNTVYLVPHGAVRLEALGMRDAPLQDAELERARALVARGLAEGAVGFSTGLSYYPGSYSDTDELVELCRAVAAAGGVYVTHIRSVFRGAPFDPVEEALEIARRSGVRLHYSHFRTSAANAGRASELMAKVDAARAAGLDVTLDTYPYPTGSSTGLYFLPPWVHEGGVDEIVARLADPSLRARIVAGMTPPPPALGASWDDIVISHAGSAKHRPLVGRSLGEAARARGAASPQDLLCDLLAAERLEVGWRGAPPAPEVWERIDRDVLELLERPFYMVGSDAIMVGDRPHPRAYGCFPRLLGTLRRRHGRPSLETLVNRMTAVPAERFRLSDRGLLRPGKAADIVVFDPGTIADTATYEEPRSYPVGVEHVLVNGHLAVEHGAPTGALAGRALP